MPYLRLTNALTFITLICLSSPLWARCTDWAAQLETLEGKVEWAEPSTETWHTAAVGAQFCYGDRLKVVSQRAAIRLANDTLVRLQENSLVTFLPEDKGFWFEVKQGIAHFLSRTPKQFSVKAPYLNAAVDGTEFVVNAQTGENRVAVFEGDVRVNNEFGEVRLLQNMETSAQPGNAPQPPRSIRLQNAAEWILYYPPMIVQVETPQPINALIAQEKYSEAISALNTPEYQAQPALNALTASLAFNLGRVDDAQHALDTALKTDSQQADALALKAMAILMKGDPKTALQQTQGLTQQYSQNISVLQAHAYALQGNGEIENALKSQQKALTLAPNNLDVLARTAELQLSTTNQGGAKKIIQRALKISPKHSRLNTLAGFIALNNLNAKKAKRYFNKALSTNPNEPLTHLGMALSHIQSGDKKTGQKNMELAVLLDPGSGLLRSYLGKTYAHNKQTSWADAQYELAKQLDPNDPTPWFYQAHLKHEQNKSGEALKLITTAIEKNDNRAVYRSRLMLDSDAAARSGNLSSIYDSFGFVEKSKDIAADLVSNNFMNYTGHNATLVAYNQDVSSQILRAREANLTRLLAPISESELSVGVSESNLPVYPWLNPHQIGLNEYTSLFEHSGIKANIAGFSGSQNTEGYDWQVSGTGKKFMTSVGQYDLSTDGYKLNNDLEVHLTEAAFHYQPTEKIKILYSANKQDQSSGDLINNIDSAFFDSMVENRQKIRKNLLGSHINTNQLGDFLIQAVHYDMDIFSNTVITPFPGFSIVVDNLTDVKELDNEFSWRKSILNSELQLGIKQEDVNLKIYDSGIFTGNNGSDFLHTQSLLETDFTDRLSSTASLDHYRYEYKVDQLIHKDDKLGHHIGVTYRLRNNFSVSIANWESVSEYFSRSGSILDPNLFGIQTIDDTANFTDAKGNAILLKLSLNDVFIQLNHSQKEFLVTSYLKGKSQIFLDEKEYDEHLTRLNIEWHAHDIFNVFARLSILDNQGDVNSEANSTTILNKPVIVENFNSAVGVNIAMPAGLKMDLEIEDLAQKQKFLDLMTLSDLTVGTYSIRSDATLLNAKLNWSFFSNAMKLKLQGLNLTDQRLSIFQSSLQAASSQSLLARPPLYAPSRSWLLTFSYFTL
jgi:Flp pilus assembly protein TadD